MQVNFNPSAPKSTPQFGMALEISSGAKKIIANRVNDPKKLSKLFTLITQQRNNPIDIEISAHGKKRLLAEIKEKTQRTKNSALLCYVPGERVKESIFSSIFRNPISFIEKQCKKVDHTFEIYRAIEGVE